MKLHLIVAFDKNRLIGDGEGIPWHLPNDLKKVKAVTMGHTLIMGENTYRSIGHPLKGRKNVILSDREDFDVQGAIVVHSKEEALEVCKNDAHVFIFGGASIYKLFIDDVELMHITFVDRNHPVDETAVYFPNFDANQFVLKYCKKNIDVVNYYYTILERK